MVTARVTIFQVCHGRELNLVEIKSSSLLLTKIFFTLCIIYRTYFTIPTGVKEQ